MTVHRHNKTESETYAGYKEDGYLPEAFINMLLMLGWNPGTEQEIFPHEEMIDAFSLDRVVKSGARFDPEKAKWFNENWLRAMDNETLCSLLKPLAEDLPQDVSDVQLAGIVPLLKERVSFIHEFLQAEYLFSSPTSFDEKTVKKKWKEQSGDLMTQLAADFGEITDFNALAAKETFSAFMEAKELGFGQIGPALRLLLSGLGGGPDLFEIMFATLSDSMTRK